MSVDIDKIAALFDSRWFQGYVRSKLKTDPLYAAVFQELEGSPLPLLDIGCGLGVSAFYLRERGFENPVMGIDYDAKKIEAASVVAKANYSGMEFHAGDAREGVPDFSGNVTILDILQFFEQDERGVLLRAAARSVAEGGKLVIRSGVVDDSWRFRITRWADFFAKATFWMKAAPISYPTIPEIATVLEEEGLRGQASPLWGNTPFNNYFFVFER